MNRLMVPTVLLALAACCVPPRHAGAQQQRIVQGVHVDPEGVLQSVELVPGRKARRLRSQKPRLTKDVARRSPLRKVSLTRLGRLIERSVHEELPDEVRYLAGLHRVDYIFAYPEQGEVVIAGPAEGWVVTPAGYAVTRTKGEVVLELDDLVWAIRAFPPGAPRDHAVGCSIDPTPQGTQRVQALLAQLRGTLNPRALPQVAAQLQEAMGPHHVVVFGTPHESSIAFKLVAADYAMKMIAIGTVRSPVRAIKSYVDTVPLTGAGRTLFQRWWFVPVAGIVSRSEDGTVWSLADRRVQLLGESDRTARRFGDRPANTGQDRWNRLFARRFTDHFPELARRAPVFGELENVFDLLTVAIVLEYGRAAERAGWDRSAFLSGGGYEPKRWPTPRAAQTLARVLVKGARATTPIGGVRYSPEQVLSEDAAQGQRRVEAIALPDDPDRWWWD